MKVTLPGYGSTQYYRNVADHLLMGEELLVKPEQARRVIGVIDAAQRSSSLGCSVAPGAWMRITASPHPLAEPCSPPYPAPQRGRRGTNRASSPSPAPQRGRGVGGEGQGP